MRFLGRAVRIVLLVNGAITLLAFLTATEGCHARLPFALPLSSASDFVVDSRGHVFVHSDFHRAITEYDAAGRFVQNLAVPGGPGRGLLAVDDRDRLYVDKADLLAVYEPGGQLVETHGVPAGGERSWRLLPDGSVTHDVGKVDDALAWTLRPRRAAARGGVLFVDWGRRRRPIGILGNPLLKDPFTGKDGGQYEYRGILAGIVRLSPVPSAPPRPSSSAGRSPGSPAVSPPISPGPPLPRPPAVFRYRPSWGAALFTYPHSLVVWLIVPAVVFRARRARARRRAAAAAATASALPPAGAGG